MLRLTATAKPTCYALPNTPPRAGQYGWIETAILAMASWEPPLIWPQTRRGARRAHLNHLNRPHPARSLLVRPALDLVPVLEPLPVSLDALGRGPLPVSLDALGRGTPVVLHNALTGV